MPRGINRYDEARLQGRLWELALGDIAPPSIYVNFNRPATISGSSGVIDKLANMGALGTAGDFTSIGGLRPSLLNQWGVTFGKFTTAPLWMSTTGTGLGGTNYTIMGLARITPGSTNKARVFSCNGVNHLWGWWNGGKEQWFDTITFITNNSNPETAGVWRLVVCRVSSASVGDMTSNGVPITVGSSISTNAPFNFELNGSNGGSECSDCEIFSFATFNQRLNDVAVARIQGAWAWEAGLVEQVLPASHPFRNRPPLIGD